MHNAPFFAIKPAMGNIPTLDNGENCGILKETENGGSLWKL